MGKRGIYFWVLLSVVLTLFFLYQKPISQTVLTFSNTIKNSFLETKDTITSRIENYINQAKKIETLKSQLRELEPKASLFIDVSAKLNHILKEVDLKSHNSKLHLVRVLSYKNMSKRLDQFWLEFKEYTPDKQYGLLYKGLVSGVVIEQNGKPVASLISSPETIFSVVIGKKRIEGVAFGDGEFIKIKYIPKYKEPKVGDEVITSGFDNIFYEGIKVGKVVKIIEKEMYKEAIVKPFVVLNNPKYFYAVETE